MWRQKSCKYILSSLFDQQYQKVLNNICFRLSPQRYYKTPYSILHHQQPSFCNRRGTLEGSISLYRRRQKEKQKVYGIGGANHQYQSEQKSQKRKSTFDKTLVLFLMIYLPKSYKNSVSNYPILVISQQIILEAQGKHILQEEFINHQGKHFKPLFKCKGSCFLEDLKQK
ncbi:unnamed protein product [Paramecium pentaurelia]|uniref:Uncharacterized protein n=1 Tax=Paramecium pentaurelia TaxID=43138 RepID=A0A8S1YEY2_9CILI|nr:unnamed protein product [Paramecium pentaurelia]